MRTLFGTKAQAKSYADVKGGTVKRTHRGIRYAVETPDLEGKPVAKVQAGDKVEDEESKVLIGDGAPVWPVW